MEQLQQMQLEQRATWEHIQMHENANHRGIVRLQQDIYQNFPQGQHNPYMPFSDQFDAYVAWLGDNYY